MYGIQFHDLSRIEKYAHFSISLLFFFLFHRCRAYIEWALSLNTAKQSLEYSYPGLQLFKNLILQGNYKL